jgi:hypothetical protein
MIPWCQATIRKINQIISAFQLTPDNVESQLWRDPSGREECILDMLCREVHCCFPENPQFARLIPNALARRVKAQMRELHKKQVVVIYELPDGGAKRVYWPPYTRDWQKADWDGEYGGRVDKETCEALALVAQGHAPPPHCVPVTPSSPPFRPTQPVRAASSSIGSDNTSVGSDNTSVRSDGTYSTTASSELRFQQRLAAIRQPPGRQGFSGKQPPQGQGTSRSARRRHNKRKYRSTRPVYEEK